MTIGGAVLRFQPSIFSGSSAGSRSLATNAMRVESGDHWMSLTPPLKSLTRCASPPERLSSQICPPRFFSSSVPREEIKARYLLSGLQRGEDSLSGDEVSWSVSLPSHLTIQTSVLRRS